MKNISWAVLLLVGMTATSCSSTLSEDPVTPLEMVDLSFSISGEGFQTDLQPFTRASDASVLQTLDLALYTKSENTYTLYGTPVHSTKGSSDFGTLSYSQVALGTYYVVCLGSLTAGSGDVDWTNFHQISYAGGKVPRCFAAIDTIQVSSLSQTSYNLTLEPAVAVVNLIIRSVVPESVKTLQFDFTNTSNTLDAEKGLAGKVLNSNSENVWTCSVPVSSTGKQNQSFLVNTFLPTADMSANSTALLKITALGENSESIQSHDFTQVPFKKGYFTNFMGDFFNSVPKFVISVDNNWPSIQSTVSY